MAEIISKKAEIQLKALASFFPQKKKMKLDLWENIFSFSS